MHLAAQRDKCLPLTERKLLPFACTLDRHPQTTCTGIERHCSALPLRCNEDRLASCCAGFVRDCRKLKPIPPLERFLKRAVQYWEGKPSPSITNGNMLSDGPGG
jgi:hypothetical protein